MVTNTVLGQGEICIHVELLGFFVFFFHDLNLFILVTLDSGINIGVRLLIFENFWSKKKLKNDRNA